ncbi:hypothetical protein [Streptosporangium sp. NPDC048865]|uniref:hypothetical protein n=1 Tax=Streptosporangium sp. NPDC048865 TaxID=3155766 RepID=UPI003422A256
MITIGMLAAPWWAWLLALAAAVGLAATAARTLLTWPSESEFRTALTSTLAENRGTETSD